MRGRSVREQQHRAGWGLVFVSELRSLLVLVWRVITNTFDIGVIDDDETDS